MLGVYIVGGLVAFPVPILIAATAAAFGPWLGLRLCGDRLAGERASSPMRSAPRSARDTLRAVLGPRLKRVQRRIVSGGVLAIAAIRLVPIAPFTVVNLVAGASEIRSAPSWPAPSLGMLPGPGW